MGKPVHANDRSEHEPEQQRRDPDGDPRQRRARCGAKSLQPSLTHLAGALRTKEADDRRHRENRPHPPDGCDAADLRPGTGRLAPRRWKRAWSASSRWKRRLLQLAQGGTAVGTGINAHPDFSARFCAELSKATGLRVSSRASKPVRSRIATQDTAVELSGQLRTLAVGLMKIANDLRWMNSGPLAGLGEIALPALQPGSSIMPGKVNPVIPEATAMVAAEVMGNDVTIAVAGQSGNFQLNVMLPLIGYKLIESLRLLANVSRVLADKAVAGFTVNESRLKDALDRNPILVTALNPVIGYEKGAAIAKKAYAEGKPILEVAAKNTDLPPEELKRLLDPADLARGGIKGGTSGGG
jgi:fumarate hydratase class II